MAPKPTKKTSPKTKPVAPSTSDGIAAGLEGVNLNADGQGNGNGYGEISNSNATATSSPFAPILPADPSSTGSEEQEQSQSSDSEAGDEEASHGDPKDNERGEDMEVDEGEVSEIVGDTALTNKDFEAKLRAQEMEIMRWKLLALENENKLLKGKKKGCSSGTRDDETKTIRS